MKVDTLITAQEATPTRVASNNIAVVIDVFRATSVIATALASGASRIFPVTTVTEALELKTKYPTAILGGERNAVLIDGFDKDNSPRAYQGADVRGRDIIFSTTNGTRAINNCSLASKLFIASFLNLNAIALALAEQKEADIVLVCAGSDNRYTLEDALCAGAIIDALGRYSNLELTDISINMLETFQRHGSNLEQALTNSFHYKRIKGLGLSEDIAFCLRSNIFDVVPIYNNGQITL